MPIFTWKKKDQEKGKVATEARSSGSTEDPHVEFTKLVTQLECGVVETYHFFEIHKRGETPTVIIFHTMGDIENNLAMQDDDVSNRVVDIQYMVL